MSKPEINNSPDEIVSEPIVNPVADTLYQSLINQVPAECVTVPIIMECLLEQVVLNTEEKEKSLDPDYNPDESELSEFDKFGRPDWGNEILQGGLSALPKRKRKEDKSNKGPYITPPLYIKNGDYASIRACHLNETVASHIASTQVSGDLRGLQGLLWQSMPEFDKGLYIKMLGNLNHFMYFLPPDAISFEDMFFIIHLLLSAGVEAHLQNEATAEKPKPELPEAKIETEKVPASKDENKNSPSLENVEFEQKMIEGTKLVADHTYLAIDEAEGVQYILAADNNGQVALKPVGKPSSNEKQVSEVGTSTEEQVAIKKPLSSEKAADIAVNNAIDNAVDLVAGETEEEEQEEQAPKKEARGYFFGEEESKSVEDENKFIACEPEWFQDLGDFSVLKALLECPALLAISESGALDVRSWVETYLLSSGLPQLGTEGLLIGELKEWNYVEELVSVQTVQLLHEATLNYLSMQRMYCPFYDTILFIFNNPVPKELKSQSKFIYKLKDLQSFEELMGNAGNGGAGDASDSWRSGIDRIRAAGIIDSLSLTSLLKIVPDEQWLLVPSIKYTVYKEQSEQVTPTEAPGVNKNENSSPEEETGENAAPKTLEIPGEEKTKGGKNGKHKNLKNKKGKASSEEIQKPKAKRSSERRRSKDEQGRRLSTSEENGRPSTPEPELDIIPSFHLNEAIGKSLKPNPDESENQPEQQQLKGRGGKFDFYDLGKKVTSVTCDTFRVFPMDGTTIQYDISTIEPKFRMLQLTIAKSGHQAFFYPYYIPREQDLSGENYVVCSYFHLVHKNGTIFAFQDLRAREDAPYIKLKQNVSEKRDTFNYDKVLFGSELEKKRQESLSAAENSSPDTVTSPPEEAGTEAVSTKRRSSGDEDGHKKNGKRGKGKKTETELEKTLSEEKAVKAKKKKKKAEAKAEETTQLPLSNNEDEDEGFDPNSPPTAPPPSINEEEMGEWVYSDEEILDDETGELTNNNGDKKRSFYIPNWDNAEIIVQPTVHSFKVTLPSGLLLEVDDVDKSNPVSRHVKQSYSARGTAFVKKEVSRHYTMNGSVLKFMQNGTIQILTARGVTVNIKELSASAERDEERIQEMFQNSENVRIYNGEIILPSGEYWEIVEGKRVHHDPIYVFTTGPLPGGEIFRRRQDGVIYMHRHDGTTITHYPDGTRFTTRMVLQRDNPEDMDDWVICGLKYMIEHPNYCSVIFNSLSGNTHIRLPSGDWVRVFGDGSIKVNTIDDFSLDVDGNLAILKSPPCADGDPELPNITAVKLWHSKDSNAQKLESKSPPETSVTKSTSLLMNVEEEEEGSSSIEISQTHSKANNKKGKGGKHSAPSKLHKNSSKSHKGSLEKGKKPITMEGMEGEELEEEAYEHDEHEEAHEDATHEEEEEMTETEGEEETIEGGGLSVKATVATKNKKFDIQEFLNFTANRNMLAVAVDTFSNKFSIDLYGATIVERSENKESQLSTEELIQTLSEHCKLPKEFVSGILHSTSSDDLATAAKRIEALRKPYSPQCGALPPTKIFVVKRNMSGYEYFRESQIEGIANKARNNRESMVIVDPLPGGREPRKYITIMQPVSENTDKPKGMWTNLYREPVFRPTIVTNKDMQLAKREDLRWFGYVLNQASKKRPKFICNAKADFLRKRQSDKKKSSLREPLKEDAEEEEQDEEEMEMKMVEQSIIEPEEIKPGKKGKDQGKTKAEKKEKAASKKKDKKSSKQYADKVKQQQGKEGSLKTTLPPIQPIVEDEEEENQEEEEEGNGDRPHRKEYWDNVEIGKYPENVEDIKGVYDVDEGSKFQPQFHADICTEKKAIVVRSFVEIPRIDEKMQRALLAASASYSQTVQNQVDNVEANKLVDTRTEEEKEEQAKVKQELIEKNLDDMHLLEQRAGQVLCFHL